MYLTCHQSKCQTIKLIILQKNCRRFWRKEAGNVLHKTTVTIKKPRIENDDILITDYTKVSISAITQCMIKYLKITNIVLYLVKPVYTTDLIFKQLLAMSLVLTIMNVTKTKNSICS